MELMVVVAMIGIIMSAIVSSTAAAQERTHSYASRPADWTSASTCFS